MLGDLTITSYAMLGASIDHSLITAWGLLSQLHMSWIHIQVRGDFVFRPCYKVHTSPSRKLRDYISKKHLAMHFSVKISPCIFLFRAWHHVPASSTIRLGN